MYQIFCSPFSKATVDLESHQRLGYIRSRHKHDTRVAEGRSKLWICQKPLSPLGTGSQSDTQTSQKTLGLQRYNYPLVKSFDNEKLLFQKSLMESSPLAPQMHSPTAFEEDGVG